MTRGPARTRTTGTTWHWSTSNRIISGLQVCITCDICVWHVRRMCDMYAWHRVLEVCVACVPDMCYVWHDGLYDVWQMTYDIRHVMCDMWYLWRAPYACVESICTSGCAEFFVFTCERTEISLRCGNLLCSRTVWMGSVFEWEFCKQKSFFWWDLFRGKVF
jgi:hypothetical protein